MNDSFRTNAFVRFNPETVASACIYLAARQLQIPLPNDPQWFLVFGINEHDIRQVCLAILRLYTRSKPNADELEKIVGEIKKQHIEAKLKAKEQAALGTSSNHGSAAATPENFNQSPSISAKKKTDAEKFELTYDGGRKDSGQVTGHKRSRSRSRSRSLVKKLRSDDSEKSRSYNSSSRSRSRSPRPKIQPPAPQQHGHASKKDDYYSRQKGGKHVEKYSGSDGMEWKKHKSLNSIRPELIVDLTSKYSKENKKDRHYKLDMKADDRYNKKRSKYARDEISPLPVRGYSSSPERLTKKKNKHKNKIVAKSPADRMESKERNGQSRISRSNHHARRVHRR